MPIAGRHHEMLDGIATGCARGIEVGPLDKPLVAKADGPVFYVHHCSTEELKARWSTDRTVDVARLHVDAVWGRASLREALDRAGELRGRDDHMDYLLASHVVDFALHAVQVDCGAAWRGEIHASALQRMYTTQSALELARDAELNGAYHDVHCWVFTPALWASLMLEMAELGLLELRCQWMTGTAPYTFEFFVGLAPDRDRERCIGSWQAAVRLLDSLPVAQPF
jgi:hypothetical protein